MGFLSENCTYDVQALLDGQPLPENYDLILNDVIADRFRRKGKDYFRLSIGFYAGELRAAVVNGYDVVAVADLNVDPDLLKLTRDDYATMLKEIAAATLALYRLSGVTVPAETSATAKRSNLVTLELIRANFDLFERAISKIADQPVRRLRSLSRWSSPWDAAQVDDRAIAEAFRRGTVRPATQAEMIAAPGYVAALRGQWTPVVSDRRREEHTAIYENQAIAGFLDWLNRLLANVSRRLAGEGISQILWKARIASWRTRIASLRRRDVFAEVRPTPFLHATSVFRMHPDYAIAFRAMMRMRGGLGAGSTLAPAVPIDETFRLYEMWFYVALLEAAAEEFPESRSDIAVLLSGIESPEGLGTALLKGACSTLWLTSSTSLTYQRRFSPTPDVEGGHTLLIEAVPDVLLGRVDDQGRATSIIIMDPKYRKGGSLLDGVRDLHVYRDAIFGDLGRLTAAALAIAPSPGSLEDQLMFRDDRPTIARAKPGSDQSRVRDLLMNAMKALNAAEAASAAVPLT